MRMDRCSHGLTWEADCKVCDAAWREWQVGRLEKDAAQLGHKLVPLRRTGAPRGRKPSYSYAEAYRRLESGEVGCIKALARDLGIPGTAIYQQLDTYAAKNGLPKPARIPQELTGRRVGFDVAAAYDRLMSGGVESIEELSRNLGRAQFGVKTALDKYAERNGLPRPKRMTSVERAKRSAAAPRRVGFDVAVAYERLMSGDFESITDLSRRLGRAREPVKIALGKYAERNGLPRPKRMTSGWSWYPRPRPTAASADELRAFGLHL
jgi:hypothetical protein